MLLTNKGIILIEQLIASVLGLLLIGLSVELYQSIYKGFGLQLAIRGVQDSAQSTVDILSTEIRQAGYIGCAKLTNDFPIRAYQGFSITPDNHLILTDHSVLVRHAAQDSARLLSAMVRFDLLETNQNVLFKKGAILMISNCRHAEIFEVKSLFTHHGAQLITPVVPLHDHFEQNAEVSYFEINQFYVHNKNLYMDNIHKTKLKLVDGIDDLHIKFHPVEIVLFLSKGSYKKIWTAKVTS